MPPRHRFLEPIHNVKEGSKLPIIREANLAKIWSSYLETFESSGPPPRFELRRTAFADLPAGLPAEAAKWRRLVEPAGIEPATSSLQS
jgi:hypothetical protein